jgi:hypothetical protein
MTIATISREGLTAVAVLVAILWGCYALERRSLRQANDELRRVLPAARRARGQYAPPMKRFSKTNHYRSWSVNGASNRRLYSAV